MRPVAIGLLVFALTSFGFLAAMLIGKALPEHHLSKNSRETVKLGIGLIATITALVLGLVIASVKSSFDDLNTAVKHTAAEILTLDRVLARYGPETGEIREQFKSVVGQRLELTWPQSQSQPARFYSSDLTRAAEQLVDQIHRLSPQNDDQRWLKDRALDLTESLLSARWIIASSTGSSVPGPFLGILIFWLTAIFACFGLYAPRNATVIGVLLVCALSVAGAIFLILEMDSPFGGLVRLSPEPIRYAYSQINQ
jgi:hypothetical protein